LRTNLHPSSTRELSPRRTSMASTHQWLRTLYGPHLNVSEDEVISFIASSISSVWALELLLLLKRNAPGGRLENELVQELRSSTTAVSDSLRKLRDVGLVVEESGLHYYRPAGAVLDQLATEVEKLYAIRPAVVIKTIVSARHQSVQAFADSFKLKE
jgi:biotin operon repressor